VEREEERKWKEKLGQEIKRRAFTHSSFLKNLQKEEKILK
jgi:hypothetical protein